MSATVTKVTYETFTIDPKHPMRIKKGSAKGKMPHEMTATSFDKWLILNGMNEPLYWENIHRGETFVRKETKGGFKRVSANKLNPDQRGWAMHCYSQHFNTGHPWLIDPTKPSRPIPDYVFEPQHDITYPTQCDCESNEISLYGTAWNGRALVRCTECRMIMVA
jgi:hypothetical protein